MHHVLDVLCVLLISLCIPEDNDMLTPFLLQDSIHQGAREVAPEVVGPDVCEEDVGVHCEREPQAVAFPRDRPEVAARNSESPQEGARRRVELHDAHLPVRGGAALRLHPRDGDGLPVGVPLQSCAAQLGVDQHGLVVGVAAHDLHTAVLEAHAERGHLAVGAGGASVPIDACNGHRTLGSTVEAVYGAPMRIDALVVIYMHLPVQGAEEDVLAIRRPLHEGELCLDLLAPQPLAIYSAHDDRAVLVDDADLLAVRAPLHVAHDASVAVVDHFLEPDPAVQHPHNDQAVLVACGELPEVSIPRDDHYVALVPFERLIHGKIALGTSSFGSPFG
mmetsp:Transcript_54010/g.167413  ORF Transcript_54010/g.167413 Transcript_54010/m.167413 type:complete len:333 (-) Transcript_54010:156-1154(-)